jgi:hypothetical protein
VGQGTGVIEEEEKVMALSLGSPSNLLIIIWLITQFVFKKRIYLRCIFNDKKLKTTF